MENSRLNQALASWTEWSLNLLAKPVAIRQLPGFTNQSHVLDAGNQQLVLRLNRPGADSLGICRQREYLIWQAMADMGIAPRPIHINRQLDFVIYPYLEGRIWTAADMQDPNQIKRLGNTMEKYQHACIVQPPRNYVDYLQHYWKQLEGTPAATPGLAAEWRHFVPELQAFQQAEWTPVLTHHDLIPENIIDDGQRLYIVDWEYAAPGHPQLDWCCISGDQTLAVSKIIGWINRLWWLLTNNADEFDADT